MVHKIKCTVSAIGSDGWVKVKGTEGCYLKWNNSEHNVYWNYGNDKIFPCEDKLLLQISDRNSVFEMLVNAKSNNQKVELDVEINEKNKEIKSVVLGE